MTRPKSTLDEEKIIELIWKEIGSKSGKDPFDDDVAWVASKSHKYLVQKADMLVAATDCPKQMSPSQMALKSITSCASDFAAKGVKPSYCLLSIGLPKKLASRRFVTGLGVGFSKAQRKYEVRILAGDMNETAKDIVIDCAMFGFSDRVVRRAGARPRDLVGVSGSFGHQRAGLMILLGAARSRDNGFKERATRSVLEPSARLELGAKIAPYLSSSIDSSDGLALSLHHLAESSHVSIRIANLPFSNGIREFARINGLNANDLVLYGGEEYEIVCTFNSKYSSLISSYGIKVIGTVVERSGNDVVSYDDEPVQRRGWLHFR